MPLGPFRLPPTLGRTSPSSPRSQPTEASVTTRSSHPPGNGSSRRRARVPPEVAEQLDPKLISAGIDSLSSQAQRLVALIKPLIEAAHRSEQYRLERMVQLEEFIEERGPRSGEDTPTHFIGVSNAGGLVPFKGAVA